MHDEAGILSESQAKRVLDRAAELEARGLSETVSLAELRAAASEAGFSPAVVDRAIAETLRQSGTQEQSVVVQKGFIISRSTVSVTVSVSLSDSEIRRVVSLNTPYFEADASVHIDETRAWWKDGRGFRFDLARSPQHTILNVSSPLLFGDTRPFRRRAARAMKRLEAIVSFVAAASAAREL